MSKLCDSVIAVVREAFPQIRIRTEEFVKVGNQKLFLDIFIPQLGIVIEVHGRQHDEYVDHFHSSVDSFRAAKRRDSLKEEWVDSNGYTFVVLREKDLPLTKKKLLEILDEANSNG